MHAAYAKSVDADFFHEDKYLRWQDRPHSSKLKRYTSWVINALFFPNKSLFNIFLTESIRIPQYLMKKFWMMRKDQKLVAIICDETLYFIINHRYPKLTIWLMRSFLNNCDALICISKYQAELAEQVVSNNQVKILTMHNGINLGMKDNASAKLSGKKIVFVGNIESEWRVWYKGFDLMISTFEMLHNADPSMEFHIVGLVDDDVKTRTLVNLNPSVTQSIFFHGYSKDLFDTMRQFDLVLHTARGEAWGITIQEAMAVGVPAIVSKDTGIKELVEQVADELVVELESEKIFDAIVWYFGLSNERRLELGELSKSIAGNYTEDKAIDSFQKLLKSVEL